MLWFLSEVTFKGVSGPGTVSSAFMKNLTMNFFLCMSPLKKPVNVFSLLPVNLLGGMHGKVGIVSFQIVPATVELKLAMWCGLIPSPAYSFQGQWFDSNTILISGRFSVSLMP